VTDSDETNFVLMDYYARNKKVAEVCTISKKDLNIWLNISKIGMICSKLRQFENLGYFWKFGVVSFTLHPLYDFFCSRSKKYH
jgi:hypothetical protein